MDNLNFDKENLLKKYQNPLFVMAYGSGIIKQDGYNLDEISMIDFVFGVENTKLWHKENLKRNPKDYSGIVRIFGYNFAEFLQKLGAKIYYNPFIDLNGVKIKYGVIQINDLFKDLEKWETLYVSGRLHKPVKIISSTTELEKALKKNLEYAFNVAILLLGKKFSEEDLYRMIASISYIGDSRMKHGENPNKVKNIVSKNIEGFRILYSDTLLKSSLKKNEDGTFSQDISLEKSLEIIKLLPKNLLVGINYNNFINRDKIQEIIKKRLFGIINSSSLKQTLKGILTSGIWKSIKYASEKLKKAKKGKGKN